MFNSFLFNNGLLNGEPVEVAGSTDVYTFANYGLQNSNIITEKFDDDSGPDTIIDSQNFPRGNGKIFVDSRNEIKIIRLKGALVASSLANLIALIDEFKKYTATVNGILKKIEGGVTRQYIANRVRCSIPREHWNIDHTPYELEFHVFAPYGFDDERTIYTRNLTASTNSLQVYHAGNAEGRVILGFIVDSETAFTSLTIENTDTSESITIAQSFNAGDYIEIDGENQTVKVNSSAVDFTGTIPNIKAGSNTFSINITDSGAFSIVSTIQFYNYYQ